MSFIKLTNITKVYGQGKNNFHALKGVSLDVHQGDFIALMGPSGSGKSSLANILGCLDTPSSGEYIFNGTRVNNLSANGRALLRRHHIGFIFQGFNLLSRTNALENVELPLLYRGVGKKKRQELALKALDMVGLKEWAHHSSNELSGGQCQRVAIARAIITRPQFLLADEPTGNLDTKRSIEIMEILQILNSKFGITILMVTHEREMAKYAKSQIHFLDGKIDAIHKTTSNIKKQTSTRKKISPKNANKDTSDKDVDNIIKKSPKTHSKNSDTQSKKNKPQTNPTPTNKNQKTTKTAVQPLRQKGKK